MVKERPRGGSYPSRVPAIAKDLLAGPQKDPYINDQGGGV